MNTETKKCPFCAEEIQTAAIKCKHCSSVIASESESSNSPSINPAQEHKKPPTKNQGKAKLGKILLGVGTILVGYFLLIYDVTVYSSVQAEVAASYGAPIPKYYDQGRQQTRNLAVATGLVLTVIGSILIVVNRKND